MRSFSPRPRRGMTLVELLVVITIAVILIAVAIPMMRPQLKDRKLREASRQVNTFIAAAKARAAETGRPCGIWIKRHSNLSNASTQLFLAETPLPFAGESIDSTVNLVNSTGMGSRADMFIVDDNYGLIKANDYVQFNFRGPKYRITSTDPADVPSPGKKIYFTSASGAAMPAVQANARFQVFRGPVRSTGTALELPTNIVIDLQYSGIGTTGVQFNSANAGTGDFQIMFLPTGGIMPVQAELLGTVHLLIGRIEQLTELQTDVTKSNLADPTTIWVSVDHVNGTVTTAENAVLNQSSQTVAVARQFAKEKQTMGGR